MKRPILPIFMVAAIMIIAAVTLSTAAQWKITTDDTWCDRCNDDDEYCEVREIFLPAMNGKLSIDASPNGGISVEGWDKDEIKLCARVSVRAKKEREAEELASKIEIFTDKNTVYAKGPKQRRNRNWSVSYRVLVPSSFDLSLETTNGGITIDDVSGTIRFNATNGGIHLVDVNGDVSGETTNGGLDITLSGDRWEGEGLDVETTNGGVKLAIPDHYSATIKTNTTNGRVYFDFPVTVRGKIGKRMSAVLGDGGPPIHVSTTNGGIKVIER